MSRMKDLATDIELRGPVAAAELVAYMLDQLDDAARRDLISSRGLIVGPCAVWMGSDLRSIVAFTSDPDGENDRTASVPIDPPAWVRIAPELGELAQMMGCEATDEDAQRMRQELESAGWVARFDATSLYVEPDEDAWETMVCRACGID